MYEGEFQSNCNEEAVIKAVGKITQQFVEFEDLQKQIELRKVLDEVLYHYEVKTKVTALVASDIEEKVRIFFASKKLEGMSQKTIINYTYVLSRLANFIRKPLTGITAMDMRMYLNYASKDVKSSTVNSWIYCFKSFFTWLVDNDYLIKNPMNKLKATKVPKRVRKAMTEKEIELLRQACKNLREESIVEFLIATGCRLSEVVGVNKEDINWYEKSLFVIGKGNKERKVYFNTKAEVLLNKYIKSRTDDCPALFITERRPFRRLQGRGIEVVINNIAERAGFDKSVYPHLFRHSFATHSLNKGVSLPTLQSLMGHDQASTTQIYAVLSEDTIQHEYRKIS
jgi:integrase/recombinase XerD